MRVVSRVGLATLLAVSPLAPAGCGGTGQVEVDGTVTYGGEPIKSGSIAFLADGGDGPNAGAAVIDGKYRVAPEYGPRPGKYKVEIRWAKPTGGKFKSESGEMLDDAREGLPEKYNNKTELSADILPGKTTVDFNLKK